MMGMHGGAYVNSAIQDADLLLAFGMRFDDRVTGNLKTYAPHAKKIHIDIDPAEIGKNVPVDVADRRRPARGARGPAARRARASATRPGCARSQRAARRRAARDILHQPDDGQLYAAHVIHDLWRAHRRRRASSSPTSASTRCGRRSTTGTSSRARYHLGRPGHDGLRAARRHRRQDGAARTPRSG